MTREEFIGRAADALMKHYGVTNETEADYLVPCVDAATAALDAVGAWELLEAGREAVRCVTSRPDVLHVGAGCITDLGRAVARAEGRCFHTAGNAVKGCACGVAD